MPALGVTVLDLLSLLQGLSHADLALSVHDCVHPELSLLLRGMSRSEFSLSAFEIATSGSLTLLQHMIRPGSPLLALGAARPGESIPVLGMASLGFLPFLRGAACPELVLLVPESSVLGPPLFLHGLT